MSAHWSERREGGGHFAIWLILTIGLRLGRRAARVLLYPITLYFYVRRPYERAASRAFFARLSGRSAGVLQVMRHIHRFAAVLLDRVFLLSGRFRDFDVRVTGLAQLMALQRPQRGLLLVGAHVGSFEALRVLAERPDAPRVCVLMDTHKTPALTELLHALNPGIAANVIDAGRPGSEIVLALAEALEAGALVAILGDRARRGERTVNVDFFGAPAVFPTAPYQFAAALGVPLVLCLGLYRGGNRYDLVFEPLADRVELPRENRQAALEALAARYAARLEHHLRQDPCNWFNWHDFWDTEASGGAARGARVDGAAGLGDAA